MKIAAQQLASSYDLIVVGAGPAGLTLARKHAALADRRVLLVESGPEASDSGGVAHELTRVTSRGSVLHPKDYYKHHSQRRLGGVSNVWAGLSATLERRSFLNGEWPIGYQELSRWYPEAADILELPPDVHAIPEVPLADGGNLVYRPLHLSPPVRFNAGNESLMQWLAEDPRVHILFNHTVTALRIEQSRCVGVTAVRTARGGGKPIAIHAERTALAAGGIQNPRLLQLSLPEGHSLPIGNYFSTHPHIQPPLEAVIDADALEAAERQVSGNTWATLQLSSEFCLAKGLLSAAFVGPWERQPGQGNFLARRRRTVTFVCLMRTEMPLTRENRVYTSATEKDALGQPATRIDFKFPGGQIIPDIHQAMSERLVKSGLGRLSALPAGWRADSGGGHMLCATRMGRSPDESVVDSNCQVHGIQGLYVAGSSVFAATEIANPTYTILALALRLAHHLAKGEPNAT